MSQGTWHDVDDGDCAASIAHSLGHIWETIWNAPENRELRDLRKTPNILLRGDRVWAPALRVREVDSATEMRHQFRRKGIPAKVRLRFLSCGQPRTNIRFDAVVDGVRRDGATDSDGVAEFCVAPDAQLAVVTLRPDGRSPETFKFSLGHIDPVNTVPGVQQRLRNLGVPCEVTRSLDDQTKCAVRAFQRRMGVEETGELDDATREELVSEHGS